MAVFFLPAESGRPAHPNNGSEYCSQIGEKITLIISILLSINVFLLLVSRILPPSAKTIPLLAKYLLLTLVLNVLTILVTVIIINVYHRGPSTHRMPDWLRFIFLDQMPMLLGMKRPKPVMASTAVVCHIL
jgi:hypothetical protein